MFVILTLIDFLLGICLLLQYWFKPFEWHVLAIIFSLFFLKAFFFTIFSRDYLSMVDLVISPLIFTIFFISNVGIFFWISVIYLIYKIIMCTFAI